MMDVVVLIIHVILLIAIPISIIIMVLAASKLYSGGFRNLIFTIAGSYIFFGTAIFFRIIRHLFFGVLNYNSSNYSMLIAIEHVLVVGSYLFAARVINYAYLLSKGFGTRWAIKK